MINIKMVCNEELAAIVSIFNEDTKSVPNSRYMLSVIGLADMKLRNMHKLEILEWANKDKKEHPKIELMTSRKKEIYCFVIHDKFKWSIYRVFRNKLHQIADGNKRTFPFPRSLTNRAKISASSHWTFSPKDHQIIFWNLQRFDQDLPFSQKMYLSTSVLKLCK